MKPNTKVRATHRAKANEKKKNQGGEAEREKKATGASLEGELQGGKKSCSGRKKGWEERGLAANRLREKNSRNA